MDTVIMFIIDRFSIVFTLLSKIEMFGITLFEFLVALFIISVMIPILISLAKSDFSISRNDRNLEINERRTDGK